MGCPKNIKKFLGIGYYGKHEYRLYYADWSDFLSSWDIRAECALCNARISRSFVSDDELISAGYSIPKDRENFIQELKNK